MKTCTRYVQSFNTIDWLSIRDDRDVDWRTYAAHADVKKGEDFWDFKELYDKKYAHLFPKKGLGYGLSYETYVRLISTAKCKGH